MPAKRQGKSNGEGEKQFCPVPWDYKLLKGTVSFQYIQRRCMCVYVTSSQREREKERQNEHTWC